MDDAGLVESSAPLGGEILRNPEVVQQSSRPSQYGIKGRLLWKRQSALAISVHRAELVGDLAVRIRQCG